MLKPTAPTLVDGYHYAEVGRQAAMIGNINAFHFLAITGFASIPLTFLVRKHGRRSKPDP